MIDVNNQYDSLVGARLLDFFGTRTHWHRRLWTIGLVLTLKELLEASGAVRSSILYQNSVEDLSKSAMALAGRDPGVGGKQQLDSLQRSLRTELRYLGMDYLVVEQFSAEIDSSYLTRWAASLRTAARLAPERTARAIGSYLLDKGFSQSFLHRWWSYKLRYEPNTRPLADIVDDANTLAMMPIREYEVLVAFSAFTKRNDGMPAGWQSASAVSDWLKARNFDVSKIRQQGGLLLRVGARDAHAAIEPLESDSKACRRVCASARAESLMCSRPPGSTVR